MSTEAAGGGATLVTFATKMEEGSVWLLGGLAPRSPRFHFSFASTIVHRNPNGRVKAEGAWEQAIVCTD